MTDREENILNMLIATVQFDAVNFNDYKTLPTAATQFVIVKAAIAALETDSAKQTSGARSRAAEQKSVLREAIRRKLKRYSRTARALNIDDAGLRRLFRVPNDNNDQLLLSTAREFVTQAERFAADFARLGIAGSLADELGADIAAMETAISEKSGAGTETVGATAGIDAQIERGMNAEKILDSIMHNVYFDDPGKLSEWKSARHVRRAPQKKSEPTVPTA